jgi:hypothetical protein
LLQDLSSLVGLGLVFLFMVYGLRRGRAGNEIMVRAARALAPVERYLWIVIYLALALLLARVFLSLPRPSATAARPMAGIIGNYAIATLRGFAAALVAVSACVEVRLRSGPIRTARNRTP